MYIYIYIYTYLFICVLYIHIYIYTYLPAELGGLSCSHLCGNIMPLKGIEPTHAEMRIRDLVRSKQGHMTTEHCVEA